MWNKKPKCGTTGHFRYISFWPASNIIYIKPLEIILDVVAFLAKIGGHNFQYLPLTLLFNFNAMQATLVRLKLTAYEA